MISLDYTTINPRWGLTGIKFDNWEEYALTLGFISNIKNYPGNISIHVEGNDRDGAWYKECRIHYYGTVHWLKNNMPNLYEASSAGRGETITLRINNNGYINHLIEDYNFAVTGVGYISDVFPFKDNKFKDYVWNIFKGHLMNKGAEFKTIGNIEIYFNKGWNI